MGCRPEPGGAADPAPQGQRGLPAPGAEPGSGPTAHAQGGADGQWGQRRPGLGTSSPHDGPSPWSGEGGEKGHTA